MYTVYRDVYHTKTSPLPTHPPPPLPPQGARDLTVELQHVQEELAAQQSEFNELLICLGQETAKVGALQSLLEDKYGEHVQDLLDQVEEEFGFGGDEEEDEEGEGEEEGEEGEEGEGEQRRIQGGAPDAGSPQDGEVLQEGIVPPPLLLQGQGEEGWGDSLM